MVKRRRKPKEINWQIFEMLCKRGEPTKQMHSLLGIKSEKTLRLRVKKQYGQTIKQVRSRFNLNLQKKLLDAQIEIAVDEKNVTMLIHLGKHYLNQTDKQVTQLTADMNVKHEDKRKVLKELIGGSAAKAEKIRELSDISCEENEALEKGNLDDLTV